MNDEFVSHNNSNGGWDVLSKWVSMLKRKRCMFDPLKGRKRGRLGSSWKLHCVICGLKFVSFYQYFRNVFNYLRRKVALNIMQRVYFWKRICSLCVSVHWYAENVGRAAGFPWNAGVTVGNLLPADPVFHSAPAPVGYTCFSGQSFPHFCSSGF